MAIRQNPLQPMSSLHRSASNAAAFLTTRWTCVCLAKADSEEGRRALADLCEAYYEPVVAFLRCELRDSEAARDMSHAFFAELLGGGRILSADRERGRFRSYLLGAVKHFVSRHRESARRMKRGSGAGAVSLDDPEVCEVPDSRQLSPDAEFDRQWAVTVLARGMEALRVESVAEGRELFFENVKSLLGGNAYRGDQIALASALEMSPEALRMAVHRLRKRLRHFVKAEVAGTLEDPESVQDEMQTLFAALGS